MAWHLLKSGGQYMNYGAANKDFQIDSESDLQTEPTEYGAIAIGSRAHLAGYVKEWEKGPNGWTDYNPGGSVDPQAITDAVEDWLDDHPEATTTVQDGSITKVKLNSSLQNTVDEVDALRSAISEVKTETYVLNDWELGNINYSTGNDESSSSACRTDGYYTSEVDTVVFISNPNSQTLGLRTYESNGTYVGSTNISTNAVLKCTAGRRYRIAVAGVDNPNNVTAKFSVQVADGTMPRKLSTLKQSAVNDVKSIFRWAVGSINGSNGNATTSTKYRIMTPTMIIADEDLLITAKSGFRFGVITYSNNAYSDSGWQTEYTIDKGTSFFIQVQKNPEDTTLVITEPYNNNLYNGISIVEDPHTPSADDFWVEKFSNPKPLKITRMAQSSVYSQGACTVGDKILGFRESATDHSTTNSIYIYDPTDDMELVGSMTHNLGHCATADYCEDTDVIVVGNGDASTSVSPAVWLVRSAKEKVTDGASILYTDSDVLSIEFDDIDGYGCGACFGESSDFLYLFTSENPSSPTTDKERYVYRVMLGKGSNDFSEGGYGTYVSGKEDTEYNGTAKIVKKFTFNMPGEIQGLKFINGVLYLSTDTSVNSTVLVGYIALFDVSANSISLKDLFEIPIYKNGEKIRTESEGIAFYNNYGYVAIINSGVATMLKFPVMNLF